jgi:hypothetical protein
MNPNLPSYMSLLRILYYKIPQLRYILDAHCVSSVVESCLPFKQRYRIMQIIILNIQI